MKNCNIEISKNESWLWFSLQDSSCIVTFTFSAREPTESNQFRLLAIERMEKIGKWHKLGRKCPFLHCFSNHSIRIKSRTGVSFNRQKWPFFFQKTEVSFSKIFGTQECAFPLKKVKLNFFGFIFVFIIFIYFYFKAWLWFYRDFELVGGVNFFV